MRNVKEVACSELSPGSAVPLSSTELFNIFRLFALL